MKFKVSHHLTSSIHLIGSPTKEMNMRGRRKHVQKSNGHCINLFSLISGQNIGVEGDSQNSIFLLERYLIYASATLIVGLILTCLVEN